MNMNQTEFANLCNSLKIIELINYGTYLDYIIKGPYIVKLFQYENFYIETYLHIQKDRIDRILTFNDTNKLTPYLKKIKLIMPVSTKTGLH
ncbi:MAG: hypothetical protein EBZ95_05445 [Chitinophagia bacterium]|nr:hypothetical protein [Chitinophagia bacterium]